MTANSLHRREKLIAAIFMVLAILVPWRMQGIPGGVVSKRDINVKKISNPKFSSHTPRSPLRINELSLYMTRAELEKMPSMIDGTPLGGTRHSRDGVPYEGYGFGQGGIDTCEFVTFSGDDHVIGIEGYRLFLNGRQLHPNAEGSIKELGAPSSVQHQKDGETLVKYPTYSLVISFYEDREYVYTLGQSKK
jgi:hypothetical protein